MYHKSLFDDPALDDAVRGRTQHHTSSSTTDPARCLYRGRICRAERAQKLDGSLHKMCHEHRLRANQNQRRSQTRRKREQKPELTFSFPLSSPISSTDSAPIPIQPSMFPFESVGTVVSSLFRSLSSTTKSFFNDLWREAATADDRVYANHAETCAPVEPSKAPFDDYIWVNACDLEQVTCEEGLEAWLPYVPIDTDLGELHHVIEPQPLLDISELSGVSDDIESIFQMDDV